MSTNASDPAADARARVAAEVFTLVAAGYLRRHTMIRLCRTTKKINEAILPLLYKEVEEHMIWGWEKFADEVLDRMNRDDQVTSVAPYVKGLKSNLGQSFGQAPDALYAESRLLRALPLFENLESLHFAWTGVPAVWWEDLWRRGGFPQLRVLAILVADGDGIDGVIRFANAREHLKELHLTVWGDPRAPGHALENKLIPEITVPGLEKFVGWASFVSALGRMDRLDSVRLLWNDSIPLESTLQRLALSARNLREFSSSLYTESCKGELVRAVGTSLGSVTRLTFGFMNVVYEVTRMAENLHFIPRLRVLKVEETAPVSVLGQRVLIGEWLGSGSEVERIIIERHVWERFKWVEGEEFGWEQVWYRSSAFDFVEEEGGMMTFVPDIAQEVADWFDFMERKLNGGEFTNEERQGLDTYN
ncbi:hypothetical protein C8F04DRAFT_1268069 [Mycena alexandri]|uniref:Uncharacterized protein n=1 Tax=Mycena alexandri TaxID=1745969 RepID=A0AAD6SF10_9AGAR|nr:hypothetical protein C8F04DRAFT_1268069 [Mycena alexandri]